MALVPPPLNLGPGVYVREALSRARPMAGAPTSVAVFVGRFLQGPVGVASSVTDLAAFQKVFGGVSEDLPVTYAVRDFFENGGTRALLIRLCASGPLPANGSGGAALASDDYLDAQRGYRGVLARAPVFNLVCIPPDTFDTDTPADVIDDAASFCAENYAFLLVEPPRAWQGAAARGRVNPDIAPPYGVSGPASAYAAVYFPNPVMADPAAPTPRPLSGMIAGIYARMDATRGVWKAPAGLDTGLRGAVGLSARLDEADRQYLNSAGINTLMTVPDGGVVVWGARTMNGADGLASDFAYVQVRRFANYLQQSLVLGTEWAVFEPNAEPLWGELRSTVGSFLQELFVQGAFAGSTPSDAYFVRCDATTTTPTDQAEGIANVVVGFAPVRPAEFVVLYVPVRTAAPPARFR